MSNVHIKHVPAELSISYAARTNIGLLSKPAVGKSQTIMQTAKRLGERVEGFGIWYLDLGTSTPNDVVAYMPDPTTGKLVAYQNADLPNAYETPDAQGIVLEDEALNADPTTAKVFQKYNNGEPIGGKLRKPDGIIVVVASNLMSDKSGVMQQSRAFMSRVELLHVYSDEAHNMAYAEEAGWFPMILEFFKKFPDCIDNYDSVFVTDRKNDKLNSQQREEASEEGKLGIWANMRSWERVSKLEYAAATFKKQLRPERVIANLGRGVGQQYVTFRAMYDKLASVDEILANPKKIAMPERIDELFVTVNMLAQLVPQDKVPQAAQFIARLQGDMQALAIRRLVKRSQRNRAEFDIASTKEYQGWIQDPAIADLFMAAR